MNRHRHGPAARRRPGAASVLVALVLVAAAVGPSAAAAAVYQCRDGAGRIEFRDQPCADDAELLTKTESGSTRGARERRAAASSPTDATSPFTETIPPPAGRAMPARDSERPAPSLVGVWYEDATGERMTVEPNGSFSVVAPMGYLDGDWSATSGNAYRMSASFRGRALTCSARARADSLELDCEGEISEYRRL